MIMVETQVLTLYGRSTFEIGGFVNPTAPPGPGGRWSRRVGEWVREVGEQLGEGARPSKSAVCNLMLRVACYMLQCIDVYTIYYTSAQHQAHLMSAQTSNVETIRTIVQHRKQTENDPGIPPIMHCTKVQDFMTGLLENISEVFDLADAHDKVQPIIAEIKLESLQNAHTANLKMAQL